jgi:hypothetical protein
MRKNDKIANAKTQIRYSIDFGTQTTKRLINQNN